jgi:hypothetical protein
MLQENIEMIKNLKDELTIDQLHLIKSICQGKLDELNGAATDKSKLDGQACAEESPCKVQQQASQPEQPAADLAEDNLFQGAPKHIKGAIQTSQ